jgi:hypothetical protein
VGFTPTQRVQDLQAQILLQDNAYYSASSPRAGESVHRKAPPLATHSDGQPQPSRNDLDDDTLLCVLRLLAPHHQAIARLACRWLKALVGPVAGQRLPLKLLLDIRSLPWGSMWEAFLLLHARDEQQNGVAAAVAASGQQNTCSCSEAWLQMEH